MYGPGNTVSIDSRGRRQDAPIPVEQTLREPALLDRSSNTNYTRAVDTLTGSSPGRSQAPPDPHLPSTHNGMPSYTNAPQTRALQQIDFQSVTQLPLVVTAQTPHLRRLAFQRHQCRQ